MTARARRACGAFEDVLCKAADVLARPQTRKNTIVLTRKNIMLLTRKNIMLLTRKNIMVPTRKNGIVLTRKNIIVPTTSIGTTRAR